MALENAETAEIIRLDDRSPASEVIEALQLHDTVATLEERVASLELDLERLQASRDEEMRLFTGEMDVMRARIADALNAVGETERDLKAQAVSPAAVAQQTQDDVVEQVVSGMGDAMATLTEAFERRLAAMDAQIGETRAAVERMATAVGTVLNRMDRIEAIR